MAIVDTPETALSDDDVRARYEARDYEAVVRQLASKPRAELIQQPALAFMLADAVRRVGGVPDVLELAQAAAEESRQRGELKTLCDLLNLLGMILFERGQAQAAERAWCDLVVAATQADDPQYVARASNNLGITATLELRLADALDHYGRAIAAYQRLGYVRGLVQSHHNLAIVLREQDEIAAAAEHFRLAFELAQASECTDELPRIEQERALLELYARRDTAAAIGLARLAEQKFRALGQPAGVAEALRALGLAALARRDLRSAEAALNEALSIARDKQLRLLEAETLLALAGIARLQNDHPRYYTLQQQARVIFSDMGAEGWGEQAARRVRALC